VKYEAWYREAYQRKKVIDIVSKMWNGESIEGKSLKNEEIEAWRKAKNDMSDMIINVFNDMIVFDKLIDQWKANIMSTVFI